MEIENSLAEIRKARKTEGSGRNITALIQKALTLVKKVEDIRDQKKTIEDLKTEDVTERQPAKLSDGLKDLERAQKVSELKTFIQSSNFLSKLIGPVAEKKKSSPSLPEILQLSDDRQGSRALEEIRDLKNEQRFNELRNLIQNQNFLSSILKSETSGLKDIFQSSSESSKNSAADKQVTKDMIKALSKLNEISSLLLRENDDTKSTVREIPDEIKSILQSEMDELRSILEDQNHVVSRQLQESLSSVNEKSSINSETEIVILKALAQFNKIAGVLLKEQEKTEKQTETALKALPALAKFIQEETEDIKGLIESQDSQSARQDLEELRKSVQQSLANDKLITKAIIKLNDITQLLLRDVNFTTSAVTNKLPAALTALITSETSKIKEMIESQNAALVDIIKESESLSKAEQVINEAKKMKASLTSDPIKSSKLAEEKILELVSPLLNSTDIKKELSNKNVILEFLAPLLASLKNEDPEEKPQERTANKTVEQKVLEAVFPLLQDEEQDADQKRDILRLVSSLVSSSERPLETTEASIRNETVQPKSEEKTANETQSNNEKEEFLKAQLSGQKSIVQALLKLTNITKTLLEDKEASKNVQPLKKVQDVKEEEIEDADESQEEEVRSSGKGKNIRGKKEKDVKEEEIEDANESQEEEVKSSGKGKNVRGKKEKAEPKEVDDYDFDDNLDKGRGDKRQKSLVERIATGSSATRNLKGNQALFEEFVKLAIERQRWEQAKQVHTIIQSTLTTLPPLRQRQKALHDEESEEYEEEVEEKPRNSESNVKSSSKKKVKEEKEVDEDENVDEQIKATEKLPAKTPEKPPAKTTKKQEETTKPKKTTTSTTTTTTAEPEQEEAEEENVVEEETVEEEAVADTAEDPPEQEAVEEQGKEIRTEAETLGNRLLQNSRTSQANRVNSRIQSVIPARPSKLTPSVSGEKLSSNSRNSAESQRPTSKPVLPQIKTTEQPTFPVIKTTEKPSQNFESDGEGTSQNHEDDVGVSRESTDLAINILSDKVKSEVSTNIVKDADLAHISQESDLTNDPEQSHTNQNPDRKPKIEKQEVDARNVGITSEEPQKQEVEKDDVLEQSSISVAKSEAISPTTHQSAGFPRHELSTSRAFTSARAITEKEEPENQPRQFNGPGRGRGFFRPRTTTPTSPEAELTARSFAKGTEPTISRSVNTEKSELHPSVGSEETSTASTTSDPLKLLQILVDRRVKNQPGGPKGEDSLDQGTMSHFSLLHFVSQC